MKIWKKKVIWGLIQANRIETKTELSEVNCNTSELKAEWTMSQCSIGFVISLLLAMKNTQYIIVIESGC